MRSCVRIALAAPEKSAQSFDWALLLFVFQITPLLQGLVDMGGVETFQWVTGLVLLEYLAEEGKLTLFLVGRDIIAIGIDVTKQGNI